jgi:hypothetical protein
LLAWRFDLELLELFDTHQLRCTSILVSNHPYIYKSLPSNHVYSTPPARESSPASAMTYTPSSNNNNNNADTSNTDDTPVNAQSDSTGGATAVSASASLVLGAIVAVAALF